MRVSRDKRSRDGLIFGDKMSREKLNGGVSSSGCGDGQVIKPDSEREADKKKKYRLQS